MIAIVSSHPKMPCCLEYACWSARCMLDAYSLLKTDELSTWLVMQLTAEMIALDWLAVIVPTEPHKLSV